VGIDESGTYKKMAVKKTVLCGDLRRSAAIRGESGDNIN
jgi:hypothetical protein